MMCFKDGESIPEMIINCPKCESSDVEQVIKLKNKYAVVYEFCPACKFTDRMMTLDVGGSTDDVLYVTRHRYNKEEVKYGIR